jgi:hypothetical protein
MIILSHDAANFPDKIGTIGMKLVLPVQIPLVSTRLGNMNDNRKAEGVQQVYKRWVLQRMDLWIICSIVYASFESITDHISNLIITGC